MRDQPERREVGHADARPSARTAAAGGSARRTSRSAALLDGRGRRGGRVEGAGQHDPAAGEQRAHREPQRRGVVDRAQHQVDVVGREAPQLALLGQQRLASAGVEQPATTRPWAAGGAAGEVDRPSPGRAQRRVVGQRCEQAPRAGPAWSPRAPARGRRAGRRARWRSASTSIGTGKTPRRSREITSSAYATDPGTSSATRSPGARSCGSTRPILSAGHSCPETGTGRSTYRTLLP